MIRDNQLWEWLSGKNSVKGNNYVVFNIDDLKALREEWLKAIELEAKQKSTSADK
jgi:hypothetical protein